MHIRSGREGLLEFRTQVLQAEVAVAVGVVGPAELLLACDKGQLAGDSLCALPSVEGQARKDALQARVEGLPLVQRRFELGAVFHVRHGQDVVHDALL